MKYDFEHYLQAGHGRAYVIARADPERYRDRIMAACRKDYSFDMQSEGSRAFLTYDLISLYEDPTPFIEAIKESYKDPVADKDWNQISNISGCVLDTVGHTMNIHQNQRLLRNNEEDYGQELQKLRAKYKV